jgi:hypothetical protein
LIETRRIDTAFEEPLQLRIERFFAQSALVEREIAECRDVALVKRKRMPQRNRTIVEDGVID